jgi:hypothetical protein
MKNPASVVVGGADESFQVVADGRVVDPVGGAARFHDDEVVFVFFEHGLKVVPIGGSVQDEYLRFFGVEKAAHGIEVTDIQRENLHGTSFLWVWGWGFVTFLRCKRSARSRAKAARFSSKGSLPKPRTYVDSFVDASTRLI